MMSDYVSLPSTTGSPSSQPQAMASEEPLSDSTTSSSGDVVDFLRQECGLCPHCVSFVIADDHESTLTASQRRASPPIDTHCTVCFGILSSSYQNECMLPMIKESLLPYCQARQQPVGANAPEDGGTRRPSLICADRGNHLTRESPTVNVPWLVAIRAQCAIVAAKWYLANEAELSKRLGIRLRTAEEVYFRIKEHLRSSLSGIITESLTSSNDYMDPSEPDRVDLSEQLHEEEAGYLGIHVIVLPPISIPFDDCSNEENTVEQLIPPSFQAHIQKYKQQIQQTNYRLLNPRKRFRGKDPTLKQGGDPRNNLELRARRSGNQNSNKGAIKCSKDQGADDGSNGHTEEEQEMVSAKASCSSNELHEWNMIISWLEKNTALQWLENVSSQVGRRGSKELSAELCTWLRQLRQSSSQQLTKTESNSPRQCSIHVTSWRRPFYVQGTYTKSRRDISQTPFYVPALSKKSVSGSNDGGGNGGCANKSHAMVRKGVSSVEEEICPRLALGCGGISKQNNEQPPANVAGGNDGEQQGDDKKGAVVYGMCKFHASGREDMDVRMLLPPPSIAEASAKSNVVVTGRPFVCEIFDAHRMPSKRDLENAVTAINSQESTSTSNDSSCREWKEMEMDINGWPRTLVQPNRYHGSNSKGVGTSYPLALASSTAFSGLQSETEEKVKLYGCVCWTSVPIASDEELIQKLGSSAWNEEGEGDAAKTADGSSMYPLEIRQSTPFRVLHRRSSDVRTRYILSMSACRIDDHWFRLRMSTSAGTYVKEFVHGDCGRTQPSIGSMLGGRTDITELDCEGIAV